MPWIVLKEYLNMHSNRRDILLSLLSVFCFIAFNRVFNRFTPFLALSLYYGFFYVNIDLLVLICIIMAFVLLFCFNCFAFIVIIA